MKHLGRTGVARVNEREKGWFIAWIDNSSKALMKQVSSAFLNVLSTSCSERNVRGGVAGTAEGLRHLHVRVLLLYLAAVRTPARRMYGVDVIGPSVETGASRHQGVSRDDRMAEKAATSTRLFQWPCPAAIRGRRKALSRARNRLLFCSVAYLSFNRRFVFTIVAQAH